MLSGGAWVGCLGMVCEWGGGSAGAVRTSFQLDLSETRAMLPRSWAGRLGMVGEGPGLVVSLCLSTVCKLAPPACPRPCADHEEIE